MKSNYLRSQIAKALIAEAMRLEPLDPMKLDNLDKAVALLFDKEGRAREGLQALAIEALFMAEDTARQIKAAHNARRIPSLKEAL